MNPWSYSSSSSHSVWSTLFLERNLVHPVRTDTFQFSISVPYHACQTCCSSTCRQKVSLQPAGMHLEPTVTLCRGLISSVYASADGIHVGRTSVVAASRGHLQARAGTVRPRCSVSLQASTLEGRLCFCAGTLVTTKPDAHWAEACSSRGRINNSLWGKVCLLFDPLVIHWDTGS